jgi:acid phosphatase class B
MFYRIWQRYDPDSTEFIPYNQLFDFVANLERPFCIPKPNRLKLISMNFPVCQNDLVHCGDILGLYKQKVYQSRNPKCQH